MSRHLFRGKLAEFSQCYDLHGSGLKHREEEDRKQIMVLQDELILLETGSVENAFFFALEDYHILFIEIVEVESYLEDVKKLQEELDYAENELGLEKEREKGIAHTHSYDINFHTSY